MLLDLGQPDIKYNSNIVDVEIPPELEKSVATTHEYVDFLLAGDGAVPSSTVIVTGTPGAGKTTLFLQVADLITGSGNIALYNTGEESLYQIRRHATRLNIKNGFIPGYNNCVDDIIEHMDKLRADNPGKQLFLVQDSVQTLIPSKFDPETGELRKGRRKTGLTAQLDAMISLCRYAKKHFIVMFFINQLTKDGKMAGLNTVLHLVDAHLHLGIDTKRGSETYGERIAEMKKNRFGITGTELRFMIDASGLKFCNEDTDSNDNEEEHEDALIDRLIRDMAGFTPTKVA